MFYTCGRLRDYFYIYDSDDDSCELIHEQILKSSGIVVEQEIRGSVDESRFKMMYEFEKDTYGIIFNVCSYWVEFNGNKKILIDLHFRILDTSTVSGKYNGLLYELNNMCFRNSNKFLFMEVHRLALNNKYNMVSMPSFRCIKYLTDVVGFPVPLQMFTYVMRLAKEHRFNAIDDAMNGSLYKNLKLVCGEEHLSPKCLGEIDWGSR